MAYEMLFKYFILDYISGTLELNLTLIDRTVSSHCAFYGILVLNEASFKCLPDDLLFPIILKYDLFLFRISLKIKGMGANDIFSKNK